MTEHQFVLTMLNHEGHSSSRISWNPKNEKEVARVKEMFQDLKDQGYAFFEVERKLGVLKTKGDVVEAFDPEIKELFMEKHLKAEPVETEAYDTERTQYEIAKPETDGPTNDKEYIATPKLSGG